MFWFFTHSYKLYLSTSFVPLWMSHWPFSQRKGERDREKTLVSLQTISSHPRMSKQFISGSWRRVLWTRTEPQEWGQTTCQNDQRGKRNKARLFPSASRAKALSFQLLPPDVWVFSVCENKRMDWKSAWGLTALGQTAKELHADGSYSKPQTCQALDISGADEVSLIAWIMQSSAS